MSDVFISYSNFNRKKAEALAYALEQHGLSVWWDEHILPSSVLPFTQIGKEISSIKCMVVLWSKESVESHSVITEATDGLSREILIPAIIDKDVVVGDIPLEFRYLPAAKLAKWDGDVSHPEFDKLLKSISSHTKIAPVFKPQVNLTKLAQLSLKLALMLIILALLIYWGAMIVPRDLNDSIGWQFEPGAASLKIGKVMTGGLAEKQLQPGDELISINSEAEQQSREEADLTLRNIKSGATYTMNVRRGAGMCPVTLKYPYIKVMREPDSWRLAVIHVGVVGIFLFIIFTPAGLLRRDKLLGSKLAGRAFNKFIKGWVFIWVAWLVLYLYMGVMWYLAGVLDGVPCEPCFYTAIDFLNISNSIVFFYLFFALDMRSLASNKPRNKNGQLRQSVKTVIVLGFFVLLLSSLGRFNLLKLHLFGPIVSGSFVAVSMAYVFGRLDSHYMTVSRWMLAPLYLYAVVQVVGPLLIGLQHYEYESAFFFTAFVLKIYLFVVVTIWLHDGSFENYFNRGSESIEDSRQQEVSSA
jgi:TIR domain-containing protein/PDZ domain-containing protein